MSLTIIERGTGNAVMIDTELVRSLSGTIILEGDKNLVAIGAGAVSGNIHFILKGGAQIQIGRMCHLSHLFIYAVQETDIKIGDHVGFNGSVRLQLHEPGEMHIGSGCLFAGDVEVTISDMHSIIDVESGRRINQARSVRLGERVWVGQRAMILKGATIGTGSVIGAGSIVTGRPIPPNSLAAGNPARVVRLNTSWRFDLV